MIALVAVFFLLLLIFGMIGSARGWGKEVLVVTSVVLAMAAISLIDQVLRLGDRLGMEAGTRFWIRIFILVLTTYFGYQSPKVGRIARATERRDVIGEKILSFIMGMVSGYFVVGTFWYYSIEAGYPSLQKYIIPATADVADLTVWVQGLLPPVWLDDPFRVFVALVIIVAVIIVYFV